MGKKSGKRKREGSCSPEKRPAVKYNELPDDLKTEWVIEENDFGVLQKYYELLGWIRGKGCLEGSVFEGIRNLNCSTGFPLMEVKVVFKVEHKRKSAKFLLSRSSLYISAFHTRHRGWRKFGDNEIDIEDKDFVELPRNSNYTSMVPWEALGPKCIIDALKRITRAGDDVEAGEACEIFMVHLSEASRFSLIELMIARCFIPVPKPLPVHKSDDALVGKEPKRDIIDLLTPIKVDLESFVTAHGAVGPFIKNFRALSKVWYTYALSNRKLFPLSDRLAKECGISFKRTLKVGLAVLCNTNLRKVVDEWRKKIDRNFTQEDFDFMESEVERLIEEKKILIR